MVYQFCLFRTKTTTSVLKDDQETLPLHSGGVFPSVFFFFFQAVLGSCQGGTNVFNTGSTLGQVLPDTLRTSVSMEVLK